MILITTDGYYATIRFRYSEECVRIMKSVPVHRWDPDKRQWTTETSWAQLLAKRFTDAGYPVEVDGEIWQPPPASNPSDAPLPAFIFSLPEHLRRPVYKALARVLHPDAGGDTALMQQLNATQEQRNRQR